MNASCLLNAATGKNVIMCSFMISARSKAEKGSHTNGLVEQSDDMIAFKRPDLKVVAANDSYANCPAILRPGYPGKELCRNFRVFAGRGSEKF